VSRELERGKCTVSFVQVDDARRNAEGVKRANAADAEDQLLPDAHAIVAAVEPRRQLAIFRLVAWHVGVEKQERVAAHGHLPEPCRDRFGPGFDMNGDRASIRSRGRHERKHLAVDVEIVLLLITVLVEPLFEIALVVIQTNANERDAEIGCGLDVIAGQNAQAAGIDRYRFVQSELGGEVRDRPGPQHASVAGTPGARRRQMLLHAPIGVVDAAVEDERRYALLQPVDRDLLQQSDWIVIEVAP
jgi:hypothetical protein